MTHEDGGPAFPCGLMQYSENEQSPMFNGMSLRDRIAVEVAPTIITMSLNRDGHRDEISVAACSYQLADAMLAARSTPLPDPVREELIAAIEGLLRADLGAYDKAQRVLSKAREGQ